MAILLAACIGLCSWLAVWVLRSLCLTDPDQVLRGLFGEDEREALVQAMAEDVVDAAERTERLHHLSNRLAELAWRGMPVEVEPDHDAGAEWMAWHLADGETWHVRHHRRCGHRGRRLIVGGAEEECGRELAVRAYAMRGDDVVLRVRDVRFPSRLHA